MCYNFTKLVKIPQLRGTAIGLLQSGIGRYYWIKISKNKYFFKFDMGWAGPNILNKSEVFLLRKF